MAGELSDPEFRGPGDQRSSRSRVRKAGDLPYPKFRRPGEQAIVVRLFVPDDDPLEVELNMDPQTFRGAMKLEAEAPNGLLIAQDREGKWWFCAYRSIHSWDVLDQDEELSNPVGP